MQTKRQSMSRVLHLWIAYCEGTVVRSNYYGVRMNELRRIFLCALSLSLACVVFWLALGGKLPGHEELHYWGFVTVLLAVLIVTMILTLRGRLERSAWPILVGASLGWAAASLAYLVYFGLFDFRGLANQAARTGEINMIIGIMFLPPLATLSWLFGALSGAFFIVAKQLTVRRQYAKLQQVDLPPVSPSQDAE